MVTELDQFKLTLNAQVRASDEAFLATASLLEATLARGGDAAPDKPGTTFSGVLTNVVTPSDSDKSINRSDPTGDDPGKRFGKFTSKDGDLQAVGLEPVIYLDQKARYLKHLQELRRINEGDDVGDSPGYSLDLVRIPVSINPGRKTTQGYGAEVTVSATPLFGDSVLPTTARRWVTNDLVHELSLLTTKLLNDKNLRKKENLDVFAASINVLDLGRKQWNFSDWYGWYGKFMTDPYVRVKCACASKTEPMIPVPDPPANPADKPTEIRAPEDFIDAVTKQLGFRDENGTGESSTQEPNEGKSATEPEESGPYAEFHRAVLELTAAKEKSILEIAGEEIEKQLAAYREISALRRAFAGLRAEEVLVRLRDLRNLGAGTVSRTRNGQIPFPLTQYSEVYGQGLLLRAGWEAYVRLGNHDLDKDDVDKDDFHPIHFQDVEAYVKNEIDAAYEALLLSENRDLWNVCNHELVQAIRDRNICQTACMRQEFMDKLGQRGRGDRSTLGVYGWAIIVESALLSERLSRDMNETAQLKGGNCLVPEHTPLCVPEPGPEICAAFNNYVQCRWPVFVFALDPVNQEQNVGNTYSRRREFQLALAVALATGQINAENVTRFARRLELDVQTIDLNRTIVGFSHGDNTFGWRFYPRVQVPPTEGNLTVGFRDLLMGGPTRKDELKAQRLEPGMRECTALIIRPSFLSTIMYDVSSNWFELADPADVELDMKDTVRLSRSIRDLEQLAADCVKDADRFRDGEVYRMLRHVDQLATELPLQTLTTSVPVENALGGFRMFAAGASGLAPQLYTWYGEPGIDLEKSTTLFLVGDNFSVQGTRVVAGGELLTATAPAPPDGDTETANGNATPAVATTSVELLSRRIMRVTIPPGVRTVDEHDGHGRKVDVHVATPYGITQHLHIPVKPDESAAAEKSTEADDGATG